MRLVITGGGSGGHTIPAITIYDELVERFSKQNRHFKCIYIGSHRGIERSIAKDKSIDYFPISTGKLRRYFSLRNFTDIFRIFKGFIDSIRVLKRFNPNIVFSTGGFVSVPVVIAASILKVPVVIHEQTSSIGLANKICGYFAKKIAISFLSSRDYFPIHKVVHTGYPIRKELFNGSSDRCYKGFNLDKSLPIVYITGGSSGSHKINMAIKAILADLLGKCHIIHQCGTTDFDILKDYAVPSGLRGSYIPKSFIKDELKDILNTCTLLVGRSGAGTVSEVIALGIPSIFIPLAIATRNEQYKNAKIPESIGGAVIINENSLNPNKLKSTIFDIILNPQRIKSMTTGLKSLSEECATNKILNLLIDNTK